MRKNPKSWTFGRIMFHFIGIMIFQWFWIIPLAIHLTIEYRKNK